MPFATSLTELGNWRKLIKGQSYFSPGLVAPISPFASEHCYHRIVGTMRNGGWGVVVVESLHFSWFPINLLNKQRLGCLEITFCRPADPTGLSAIDLPFYEKWWKSAAMGLF